MKRRTFLRTSALLAGAMAWNQSGSAGESPAVSAAHLPRWRGFNLLEKFTARRNAPYVERDFAWMENWGFDFVRLPTDYRCWTDTKDPKALDEKVLKEIDQAVEWGKQHKIHVNLNLHRAPGYCVNPPKEELDLWTSDEALEQFCFQWKTFAQRYKGIPIDRLSFDLLNEPAKVDEEAYAKVVRAAVAAIREGDPERLIVADGLEYGRQPVMSLADLGIAQSTRGYDQFTISHYKASWVQRDDWGEPPTWPLKEGNSVWDKDRLYKERIEPWKALMEKGVGVHVGEWGAFQYTPHDTVLAWMKDCLALWKEAGMGWSLWNLRGSFGIIDSNREDVAYEEFEGHKLDRKMLELLREN